ncbi:hypothetical protein Tco_0046513, partial [Tanacetum coccineum]
NKTTLILSLEAARVFLSVQLLRALKNSKDLSAPFKRNRLNAASFSLRLCISFNVFSGSMLGFRASTLSTTDS